MPNREVLLYTYVSGIVSLVMKYQDRLVGHGTQMENSRLPKTIFFSKLANRCRNIGGSVRQSKDNNNSSPNDCDIQIANWINLAEECTTLGLTVWKRIDEFRTHWLVYMDQKCLTWKQRDEETESLWAVVYTYCCCLCISEFGPYSHLWIH